MNGHQLELSLEELIDGAHEKCGWCRQPLAINEDGTLHYFTGLDGKRYCSEIHGSAPYLTRRMVQL